MSINTDKLRDLLLSDYNYKESQIDDVINKLLAMDPAIIEAFENYLINFEMPTKPVFFGSAPANLETAYPSLKPPAIFLLLDWIRRDHVTAYDALQDEYHYLPEPLESYK